MKILFVTLGYPPRGRYGTEFYTHQLVHGLLDRGHEPVVLHPVRDGARPRYSLEEVDEDGVQVMLLFNQGDASKRFEPSYRDERVEERFAELLDRLKPDLVHFTYLLYGLSVRLPAIAKARGVPSVITLTDYGLVCHRGQMFNGELERCGGPHPAATCARCIRRPGDHDLPLLALTIKRALASGLAAFGGLGRVVVTRDLEKREALVREAFDSAAALIAPSRGLLEAFVRAGVDPDKLVELVYAFDEAPYRAVQKSAPPTRPRFGFLAQFAPHKGLATLLEAARLLHERGPSRDWELVLHGAPVQGRHTLYSERVLARRLESRVLIGEPFEPDDAPAVIAGLSALVLPSEWDENAPLSVLQARAIGVPVLGTDVPGIAGALTAAAAARLVPVGDAEGLARRMEAVLDGEIARDPRPGLPLSLSEHLDKIEDLYRRIGRD